MLVPVAMVLRAGAAQAATQPLEHGSPDLGYRRLAVREICRRHPLGFTGPKAEAEEIKRHLAQFLHEDLKLELSETKTLITHACTGSGAVPRLRDHHPARRQQADRWPQVGQRSDPLARADDVIKANCFRHMHGGSRLPTRLATRRTTEDSILNRPRSGVPGHCPDGPDSPAMPTDSTGCSG